MVFICKLDKTLYRCVSEEMSTEDVVITEERIEHIREHHPNDYERFVGYMSDIIQNPDYIIEANKANTAVLLKEVEAAGEKFKLILRLRVDNEPADYKNSVISFWRIGEVTWRKTIKNKKILYTRG